MSMSQEFEARAGSRTRKRPPPFSLRLTPKERAALEEAAAGQPIGSFIRAQLFRTPISPRRAQRPRPGTDHRAIAKALAALGQSRLASNLNQLAKAANLGALPVTEELETELKEACSNVRSLRDELMRALGHRLPESGQ